MNEKKIGKKVIKKSTKKAKNQPPRAIKVVGITGTPGCGKTTLAGRLESILGKDDQYEFVNIAELVKERKLYSEWDDEMNCSIFDEKLVRMEIERIVCEAQDSGKCGVVLEFHSLDFLRKKSVDRVFVLRSDTNRLWERLEARNYSEKKIKENVEAEIFMECLNDCQDQFGPDSVQCLDSNTEDDMNNNIETILAFLKRDK